MCLVYVVDQISISLDKKNLEIEARFNLLGKSIDKINDHSDQLTDYYNFLYQCPMAMAMVDKSMNYMIWTPAWIELFNVDIKKGDNHYDVFPRIKLDKPEWLDDHQKCLTEGVDVEGKDEFEGIKFYWKPSPVKNNHGVYAMIMFIMKVI